MLGPVSIIVASREAANRPHVMRAIGCRISADRREVTVFMACRTSAPVLDGLRDNGAIAVVFSEPVTHQSVQLKASRVRIEAVGAGDLPLIESYTRRFGERITTIGHSLALARAILDREDSDVVALTFAPEQAYEQTPGPRAGERLQAAMP